MSIFGTALAVLGAALAACLAGAGSAKGVGLVGEAGAGVIAEDPAKFGKVLILQILPGTQGLYGFLTAFICLAKINLLTGSYTEISVAKGAALFAACMPIAIAGFISGIAQGRTAAAGVSLIAKNPEQSGKAITMAAMVETYAVLALLVSLLSIMRISALSF